MLEIIKALEKQPRGDYYSENPKLEARKMRARASKYRMASDGVLLACRDEGAPDVDKPVIPDVPCTTGVEGAPPTMTWKHLILGAIHNTIIGAHRNSQHMMAELEALAAWWLSESLRKDCNTWLSRCRLCQAASQQARREPMLKAVRSYKLFYRLQMDLMEIKPIVKMANGVFTP